MRTADSHQDAQHLDTTFSKTLDASAEHREAFLPGGVERRFAQGRLGARFGTRRANIALQAASGPEENQLQPNDTDPEVTPEARAEAAREAYFERAALAKPSKPDLAPQAQAEALRAAYLQRVDRVAVEQAKKDVLRGAQASAQAQANAQALREAYLERTALERASKEGVTPEAQAQALRAAYFERRDRALATKEADEAAAKKAEEQTPKALARAQADRDAKASAQALREVYLERVAVEQAAGKPEFRFPWRNFYTRDPEERAQTIREAQATREAYLERAEDEEVAKLQAAREE